MFLLSLMLKQIWKHHHFFFFFGKALKGLCMQSNRLLQNRKILTTFVLFFLEQKCLTKIHYHFSALFENGLLAGPILLWTFLVAQTVKRLSTMWENWVRSLGWEGSLEKEMATHSSTLALKIPWTEELGAGYYPWGRKESGTTERLHFHFQLMWMRAPKTVIQKMPPSPMVIAEELGGCKKQGKQGKRIGPR